MPLVWPDPKVFRIALGGTQTTDELLKNLLFPFNPLITQAHFPITPRETIEEVEIEIVDLDAELGEMRRRYADLSVGMIGRMILGERGLQPPTYEHAIRFVQQYGMRTSAQEQPRPIVFLHELREWPSSIKDSVLCLRRVHLELDLFWTSLSLREADVVLAGVCAHDQHPAT